MPAIRLFDPEQGFQRLERYELVGEIASGGMATVYLARLKGLGGFRRFCAIKCLLPHLAAQHAFIDMFLDEARLAAAIRHPNVVPILEVGTSAESHFIVMEYIEGDTLAGLLELALATGARLPVPIGLRIGLDLLQGLHAAHELVDENGIPLHLVHRDVSPQNILIGMDGIARITDFGIARATSRLSSTREGQLKGKLAYMAPEYIQGDATIDRRADVFAAAIVIWETLAMTRLFKSDNEAATLARVLTAQPSPLAYVAPYVSERVSRVVMRALERDRNARYRTCAEFAEALEESAQWEMRPATQRDLAKYVNRMLGDTLGRQRDEIRSCVAHFEQRNRATSSDGTRRSIADLRTLVASIRAPRREVTTTVSTTRDVPRTSRPITPPRLLQPLAALTLALFVLGIGGGIGGYLGVRSLRATPNSVALRTALLPVATVAPGVTPVDPSVPRARSPESKTEPLRDSSAFAAGSTAISPGASAASASVSRADPPTSSRTAAAKRQRPSATVRLRRSGTTTPANPAPSPTTPRNPYR